MKKFMFISLILCGCVYGGLKQEMTYKGQPAALFSCRTTSSLRNAYDTCLEDVKDYCIKNKYSYFSIAKSDKEADVYSSASGALSNSAASYNSVTETKKNDTIYAVFYEKLQNNNEFMIKCK